MKTLIKKKTTTSKKQNLILLCDKNDDLSKFNLSEGEFSYIKKQRKRKSQIIKINQYNRFILIISPEQENNKNKCSENCRMLGHAATKMLKGEKSVLLIDLKNNQNQILEVAEGIALSNYNFNKHKTKKEDLCLEYIYLCDKSSKKDITRLQNLINAVYLTRDLINEPFSHLTAKDLAVQAKKSTQNIGVKATILNKKKIEKLKMGGLLAVNKGSLDDPTFTILEWKPKKAKNKKPIVLIGKGIVYDTGGLSLKPTANSMDLMKIDMGGAGTVIGAMQAIAANKLNTYVIGLLPATDNRPSGNAYAPGDVITMHNGKTVEVLNTDAEGRLILADALSFAKKYKPELVIDLATLTGSAVAAIGHYGCVSMNENADKQHEDLISVGNEVHERLVKFPFWEDYNELIKSDVADIKNLGGAYAGAITAGKFLSHFISYPWIHIDLSAVYSKLEYGYRGQGATGVGVRLLYKFIENTTKP